MLNRYSAGKRGEPSPTVGREEVVESATQFFRDLNMADYGVRGAGGGAQGEETSGDRTSDQLQADHGVAQGGETVLCELFSNFCFLDQTEQQRRALQRHWMPAEVDGVLKKLGGFMAVSGAATSGGQAEAARGPIDQTLAENLPYQRHRHRLVERIRQGQSLQVQGRAQAAGAGFTPGASSTVLEEPE